jgi:hypothetical protein
MNTKIKSIIGAVLLISVLSGFSGCASSGQPTAKLPSWFINTPAHDSNFLYGSGSGYSKEESKNDALSHISSSLQVQIKSKFSQKKEAISQNNQALFFSNTTNKDLEAKALKIDYQNVKIQEVKVINDKFYTLVKIDKKALIKQKLYQLQEKDIYIAKQIEKAQKENSKIATITTYQKVSPDIVQAKHLVNLLKILGYDFDKRCYLENYTNDELEYTKAINSLKIKISSDNNHFKNIISSYISLKGFKSSTNQPDITIINKNNITNNKYKGWYISKVNSNIEVKNGQKTIKNHTINSVGRSSISQDLAIQSASKIFDKKIKKIKNLLY